MATRLSPGVYTYDVKNSNLTNSLAGFNITAVVGLGINTKNQNNVELIKTTTSANVPTSNQILYSTIINTFKGESIIPFTTYVLPITTASSNTGYYVVTDKTNGALKTVSANPQTGEILLSTAEAGKATGQTITLGDYVINCVDGDYLQRESSISGVKLVIPTLSNKDTIKKADGTNLTFTEFVSMMSVGTLPGLNQYTLGNDYVIQSGTNNEAQIVWILDNYPTIGSSFYISYKMNKEDSDYSPKYHYSTESIIDEYGPELNNNVVNSLTLAANLVIEGQTVYGGGVLCCQVKTNTFQGWKDAIDSLDSFIFNTYIVCGQQETWTSGSTTYTGQDLQNYIKQKINTLSSETYKKEKTAFFVPYSQSMTISEISAYRAGLNYDRITLFANSTCVIQLTDATTLEETNIELSSIYACANLSGIEGNPEYTFSEPMLRKKLSSRITLNTLFNPSEKLTLDNNYVSIFDLDQITNTTFVFVIGTTDSTNILTETRAVRRETDLLRENVRKNLEQYIGQKNSTLVASSAVETTKSLLRNFVNSDEIAGWRNVTGSYDSTDTRLLKINFEYQPYLEVRWIKVYIAQYI